jgi:hypothetical protein
VHMVVSHVWQWGKQKTYDMAARGRGDLAQRPQCVLLRSLRSPEGCGWLQGRGRVVLMLWYRHVSRVAGVGARGWENKKAAPLPLDCYGTTN